ncbi:MAG: oligosaccharide flippase family protein, partial [Alistipes sp.]
MNQLKAGAVLNYVVLGLNTAVGLAYTPYMLRMLGQSEYGLYALAASVIAYLTILDCGFGNAIIRYTAKYRAEGKTEEQYSLFGLFTALYTVIGVLTLAAGAVLFFNVDSIFGDTLTVLELERARTILLLMILNLAVTFPLSIYGAIITAYED